MKKLLCGALAIASALLLMLCAAPPERKVLKASHNAETKLFHDVIRITGVINSRTSLRVASDIKHILAEPHNAEPIVLYFNSPGGFMSTGKEIKHQIRLLVSETQRRVVCVVDKQASSMALILLSHCPERYATPDALFLLHRAALGSLQDRRPTASVLLEAAQIMRAIDLAWMPVMAAAMRMSLEELIQLADAETTFDTFQLLERGFLDNVVHLEFIDEPAKPKRD